MRVVTLDASTRVTGCALFVDGELTDHCAINHSAELDKEKRMNKMCISLVKRLSAWQPNQVWIEYPEGIGSNVLVVNRISEIMGAVRLYTALKEIEYYEAAPNEWRSWAGIITGRKKRNELKKEARDKVAELYKIFPIEDECEAIMFGCGVMNKFGNQEDVVS